MKVNAAEFVRPDPASLTVKEFLTHAEAVTCCDNGSAATVGGPTIRGVPLDFYLGDGLREEFDESIGYNLRTGYDGATQNSTYDRFNALTLPLDDMARIREMDPTGVRHHSAEFGDVAWYVARTLDVSGTSLDEASKANMGTAYDGTATSIDEYVRQNEDVLHVAFPALRGLVKTVREDTVAVYSNSFTNYSKTHGDMLFAKGEDTRGRLREQLERRGYLLFACASWIVQHRLGTTMADVLADNMVKTATRKRNGTVFGAGDDERTRQVGFSNSTTG